MVSRNPSYYPLLDWGSLARSLAIASACALFLVAPCCTAQVPRSLESVPLSKAIYLIDSADVLVDRDPAASLRLLSQVDRRSLRSHANVTARMLETRARARWKTTDLLQALLDSDSAQMIYAVVGDQRAIDRIKQLKGDVHVAAGDFTTASVLLEEALTGFQGNQDTSGLASVHRSLGSLHYFQRQFDRTWEHYHTSAGLYRATEDLLGLAKTYRSMGILAAEISDPNGLQDALAYTDTALHFARRAGRSDEIARAHANMGLITMHLEDTAAAGMHNDSALWIATHIGDSLLMMKVIENLGQLSYRRHDFATMLDNCTCVLDYARRHRMLSFARDAMRCIQDAYRGMGSFEKAYDALNQYHKLRDSTYDSSSREEILRRSLEAESERRLLSDRAAHISEMKRAEVEKWFLGGVAVLVVFAGGLFALVDRKRRRERHERNAARLQTQILRTQMNPHFIFNALNSINDYVQSSEKELASGFLAKFARLMRLVLENSRHAEVPLVQDLEALRLYMDLERARMNEKFDYTIVVDPAIDQESTMVPPLVLQPFVENAIWHGLSRKEGKGHIELTVRRTDERLVMTVEDDGVGRSASVGTLPVDGSPPTGSLGTSITRDRLAMLGQQHGLPSGFQFTDLAQGTRVEVVMPLMRES